jgi:DNA-directed RNA polymerase specialized sigma24 family protein
MTEEEFDQLRPVALAIAYWMLGSVSEAEDVVPEGSCASALRARAANGSSRRVRVAGGMATPAC